MNAPKIEERVFLLPDEEKVHEAEDTKIEGATNFTFTKEDHTIGNPLRVQLLRSPDVLFAGYRLPHPLETKLTLKIQTKSDTNPHVALMDAMKDLKNELVDLDCAFDAAVNTYKEKTNAGAMDY
jgi:DNA-directed RNA polymerase II subunit RPB11